MRVVFHDAGYGPVGSNKNGCIIRGADISVIRDDIYRRQTQTLR